MFSPFYILAEGEDLGKVIFGVVAVIVWAVSAISSSLSKQKKEQERRARELEALARQGVLRPAPAPPPPPPPLARRGPVPTQRVHQQAAPPPPIPVQQQRQQRRQGKKQQKQRIPVPPLPRMVAAPSRTAQSEEIVAAVPQRATVAGSSNQVNPIAGLLRRSLRTQIVLNEILQPPIALREPREI